MYLKDARHRLDRLNHENLCFYHFSYLFSSYLPFILQRGMGGRRLKFWNKINKKTKKIYHTLGKLNQITINGEEA